MSTTVFFIVVFAMSSINKRVSDLLKFLSSRSLRRRAMPSLSSISVINDAFFEVSERLRFASFKALASSRSCSFLSFSFLRACSFSSALRSFSAALRSFSAAIFSASAFLRFFSARRLASSCSFASRSIRRRSSLVFFIAVLFCSFVFLTSMSCCFARCIASFLLARSSFMVSF